MRVLVTGGAGFIGSAVCRYFVTERGASVLNVDKLGHTSSLASLGAIAASPRYSLRKADICDRARITALMQAFEPDAVIHLAAEQQVDRTIAGADPCIETNIVGTFRLLEATRDYWSALPASRRGGFRFLHVSSDEVYGPLAEQGLVREDAASDPTSPYAATKAASDHLALAWQRTYGLPVIVSRSSSTYGPYQFPDQLIPQTILDALAGNPLQVLGAGGSSRDWLHVEDHVRALDLMMAKGTVGETYNVGGRNERSHLAVVERIVELVDRHARGAKSRKGLIQLGADGPSRDTRRAIDAGKLEQATGWRAQESFDSGLSKTVRWYLANEAWWAPLREARSAGERLGLLKSA